MLVYKPSPARLASVSVQFPHGAPFCCSTLVKTVSSSGRHASSSLAHAQTHFGFCSRQEGLDPQVCFTGSLLPGCDPPGRWDSSMARSRRGERIRAAMLGQHMALGQRWRTLRFLLRERGAALSPSAGQAQAPVHRSSSSSSRRRLTSLQPPRSTGNRPQDSTYRRRRQRPARVGPWLEEGKD